MYQGRIFLKPNFLRIDESVHTIDYEKDIHYYINNILIKLLSFYILIIL